MNHFVQNQCSLSAAISQRLTQGYYPSVDSPDINKAPRRREQLSWYNKRHFCLHGAVVEPSCSLGTVQRIFPQAGTQLVSPRFYGYKKIHTYCTFATYRLPKAQPISRAYTVVTKGGGAEAVVDSFVCQQFPENIRGRELPIFFPVKGLGLNEGCFFLFFSVFSRNFGISRYLVFSHIGKIT